MKRARLLGIAVVLLFAGCGGEHGTGKPEEPGPLETTPRGESSPIPPGSFWSQEELDGAREGCADAGMQTALQFSRDQWSRFCGCVYQEAARRWSYREFADNFETHYETLSEQGKVSDCLRAAEMVP